MNTTLLSSEIRTDLTATALGILWRNKGQCTAQDLRDAGADEAAVSKFGALAITLATAQYSNAKAS